MSVQASDRRAAEALSSLIARLQAEPLTTQDPSEHYGYRVVWSAPDRAFRGTVDELPTLCWFADEHTAALAGIRNRAREAIAEAVAGGEEVPRPIGELREGAGAALSRASSGERGVALWVPIEIYAQLESAAKEQWIEPRLLAISRLAGSREIALLERRASA